VLSLSTHPPLPGVDAADLADVATRLAALETDPDALRVHGPALLDEAAGLALAYRAADLVLDAEPAAAAIEELAADTGFSLIREVLQMRRPLPSDEAWDLPVRPFVLGVDDEAWLTVNNRAFEWHPEQGGWSAQDLQARLAEPWVDLDGFLVHECEQQRLTGFCWTKVHADAEPPLGEIYVVAADPDVHGQGLGRSLVLAGLDHLAGRGIGTAMLWVEASNLAALRLYRDLRFTVFDSHRWWARPIS
jgi:mycothiol synthase